MKQGIKKSSLNHKYELNDPIFSACEDLEAAECRKDRCYFPYDQFCPKTCGLCT